jgi:UDP-glucose 4-epimerase
MRILVTGGAGFIASNVADAFIAAGHDVVIIDNMFMGNKDNINPKAKFYEVDIRDRSVGEIMKKEGIEVVDHHAAQISVPASVKDPVFDADINIKGTLNLLEAAAACNVKKFIFVSSGGTVYGTPDKFPVSEKHPYAAESPYGISKVAGELYVKFFAAQHGMKYTILRYSNVYGPRQLPHGEAGVVAIFIKKIMAGEVPTVFGGGKCVRDYVYVGDVAAANVAAVTGGDNNEFNIGTGVPTDTNKLYKAVQKVTGFAHEAVQGPFREGDILANYLDNRKAAKVLKWKPRVKLEQGVLKTYEFFKNIKK